MNTLKLHIEYLDNPEFIHEKQVRYSYAFRSLFKQLEMTADRQFMLDFNKRFSLNEMEFRSLKIMSEAQFTAQEETKKQTTDEIEDLKNDLLEETDSRKRFKLQRKIRKKEKSLDNNPVYGKRELLRQITRECNKEIRNEERLTKLRTEYKNNRLMPFVIVGEANQHGNRFFDLKTLNEGYCIYKPERGQKYRIDFSVDKKQKKEIKLIVEQILQENIPVTVQLSTDYIYIVYDNEKLHGYNLDERGRKREVREIKSKGFDKDTQDILIKDCYKKYYRDQEERRLKGKNPNRYVAIDMNPTNIGCSILEKVNDEGNYKVLKAWTVDFSWYFPKRHLASNNPKQKRLNNKRKYELTIALKKLFMIAERYGCAHFVMEDLDFKSNDNLSHEANRKKQEYVVQRIV